MWIVGHNPKKREYKDINEELLSIDQFNSDEEASIFLAKFLRQNIHWASKLLIGVDLFPFQEIMIKSMLEKDFFMSVLARGMSKTYSIAIFCILYAIFNPGHKIIVLSLVFRQSRQILNQIDEFAKRKNGGFLRKCLSGSIKKSQDEYRIDFVNGASILSIPLSDGQKARGQRAQVVVCDEFLTFSEKLVEEVVRPFLSTSVDPVLKQRVFDMESALIEKGLIKKEDRTKFPSPKFICLSSGAYTFDYIYKTFTTYQTRIETNEERDASYGIMQMAYTAAPSAYFNASFLEEAKQSMSDAQLDRELGAKFTQDSAGFYSAKKLTNCKREDIKVELRGNKKDIYLLSIDTQYAENESSDDFAMALIKLDPENKTGTVVHSYAISGSPLSNHIFYLSYLLTHFNIVYIICDNTGGSGQFISSCNESAVFQKLNLKIIPFQADFDNLNYQEGLKLAKSTFNPVSKEFVHLQVFNNQWIVKANQELQMAIDKKRMFFGGRMTEDQLKNLIQINLPIENFRFSVSDSLEDPKELRVLDLAERQIDLIDLTIKECTLIDVKPTSSGGLSFDLPMNLRKKTGPNKPRKDSYTALLLANWGMKCYFDMIFSEEEEEQTFEPTIIK